MAYCGCLLRGTMSWEIRHSLSTDISFGPGQNSSHGIALLHIFVGEREDDWKDWALKERFSSVLLIAGWWCWERWKCRGRVG